MNHYKVTVELRFSIDEEPDTDTFYVLTDSEESAIITAYEQARNRYEGKPFESKVIAVHQRIG
jgi:hypothetical protein